VKFFYFDATWSYLIIFSRARCRWAWYTIPAAFTVWTQTSASGFQLLLWTVRWC